MMKTLEYVLDNHKSNLIDKRDLVRLADFVSDKDLGRLQMEWASDDPRETIEWTKENVLEQLRIDTAFGFEKALGKRGISSSLMFGVIRMWNWILEDGLEDFDKYEQYGLPLFKATALKYGWPNPIGFDEGHEPKYRG